ncbi:membrane-associated protein, putative [Bodo saltans]|uniref:Membrane-associated protein, putative n=1 Tax=Bodo saltans TaxID=75058 RepID=A0A0S4IWA2_BODSA|nr:membrane-associated protein, putative [Bodo saltans]|eukprot:CUG04453.1 membrane-associated protein, putative [Bodo saltans]
MKHERRLHSTWWILWITTHIIFSFIVIFFTPPVVSLHLGPEIFTTTLVANTVNVTVVHIDVERNILYFGAGAEYGGYVGRVVLGVDCGPTPLTFQIVAGVQGKLGSQDGVGSNALFGDVHGMDGTADGKTLYCSDHVNGLIRRITISRAGGGVGATFNVTTIAGSTPGYGDGSGRQALLRPIGVALNPAETALYIGDYGNSAIRRINLSTLLVETVVKIGISLPTFLRVSPDGAFVFFADSGNNRIARVASAPGSTLVNIAGVVSNGQTVVRDGVDGSSARFWEPRGLIFSPDKSILFVGNCFGNVIQAVRMDSGDYATVTIAGNATAGFTQSSASGSRAFMSIPVATFSGIQGLTLWQPPMQPVLSKNPSWVVIAGDFENGAIRCVSGPGLSHPFPPMAFKAQGTVRSVVSGSSLGAISDAYIHPVTGALYTNDGLTMVVRYDLDNRSGEFL